MSDELTAAIRRLFPLEIEDVAHLRTLHPDNVLLVLSRFFIPENEIRRAYSTIREIYLDLFERSLYSKGNLIGPPLPKSINPEGLYKEYHELESWLLRPSEPIPVKDIIAHIADIESPELRESLFQACTRYKNAGRPNSKRHLAVWALDLKLEDPALSLREVTQMVCNCGLEIHSEKCVQQLRQQILRLRKLLLPYGLIFTWESLSEGV